MGNEKSRNHDTKGGKSGASKHQGKPKDQDGSGSKAAEGEVLTPTGEAPPPADD